MDFLPRMPVDSGAVDSSQRKQYDQRDGNYVWPLGSGSKPTLNLVHLNWNVNGISRQKKVEWRLEERYFQAARRGVVR
jgi:hypothetical protein